MLNVDVIRPQSWILSTTSPSNQTICAQPRHLKSLPNPSSSTTAQVLLSTNIQSPPAAVVRKTCDRCPSKPQPRPRPPPTTQWPQPRSAGGRTSYTPPTTKATFTSPRTTCSPASSMRPRRRAEQAPRPPAALPRPQPVRPRGRRDP
jgi:hypothetical protein